MSPHRALPLLLLLLLGTPAQADPWPRTKRATGDWGGHRKWLADHGFEIELQYTADSFARLTGDAVARYRGNVDLMFTFDTEKLGLWPGGELFIYFENGHGRNLSDDLGAQLAVSGLEGPDFTQLEELIFTQSFGEVLTLKLGKQDSGADYAAPRFPGNFVNSSFFAGPPVPLPTFPTPGMGAMAFVVPAAWIEVRGGVYEAAPEIETFCCEGFDEGVVGLGALVLRHEAGGLSGEHSAGLFHSTADDRTGGFAVTDVMLRLEGGRSLQGFVRAARGRRGPKAAGLAHAYLAGGATAHGFLGEDNTLGLGFGHARFTGEGNPVETFVELFFKWRPFDWLTFEPDMQLFFLDGRRELVGGLRSKIKL